MKSVLFAKFTQHEDLKAILLSTGNALLIEASKTDAFWGIGEKGNGKNMLGRLLMQVRDELSAVTGVARKGPSRGPLVHPETKDLVGMLHSARLEYEVTGHATLATAEQNTEPRAENGPKNGPRKMVQTNQDAISQPAGSIVGTCNNKGPTSATQRENIGGENHGSKNRKRT